MPRLYADTLTPVTTLRLREWRERRGLSVRGLADRAGVSFPTVWRIERGEMSPTVAMLEKLAAALGIAVRDLFPPGRARWRPGGRRPAGRLTAGRARPTLLVADRRSALVQPDP
jgi:transcriptional regulator with XRE-family HTH domain